MSKSITAIVTAEVLQWPGIWTELLVEEMAQKLEVDVAKIET